MVLILGAGFSGLHAAVLLKRQGISVTVIEARDRIGGRVYTKKKGDLTYEMGGEWVGTNDPLLLKACADYGLECVDMGVDQDDVAGSIAKTEESVALGSSGMVTGINDQAYYAATQPPLWRVFQL